MLNCEQIRVTKKKGSHLCISSFSSVSYQIVEMPGYSMCNQTILMWLTSRLIIQVFVINDFVAVRIYHACPGHQNSSLGDDTVSVCVSRRNLFYLFQHLLGWTEGLFTVSLLQFNLIFRAKFHPPVPIIFTELKKLCLVGYQTIFFVV